MTSPINRRQFVTRAVAASAVVGAGELGFLNRLPPLSAAQTNVPAPVVRLEADIEPLVRLIEETPRDQLLETAARRITSGTSYQEMLTALMLAGVRGIKPRPVGFQFHAVLVVNSAHLAAHAAHDRDRWLPLFWALDNYKTSQERNRTQNAGWMMAPVSTDLPSAGLARTRFTEAMNNWDEEAADRGIAALVRTAGADQIIETLLRYSARDFRDIGHKAIYTANAWRTLQTIGWRHAEPILRSLAFAMLQHEEGNPAQRDAAPDRPWRDNLVRCLRVREGWQRGAMTQAAVADLLAALRTGGPNEASEQVVTVLNQNISPAIVWDSLFLGAAELLMRQPGIVGVHCVTSINALHYAYTLSSNDETRLMMLLQGAAFLSLFRQNMQGRGQLADRRVETLEPLATQATGAGAIEEIFADVGRDRTAAARKTLAFLQGEGASPQALMAAGRRLIFTKGRDSHDYKFSSAALEDFYHVSPGQRNRYLAMGMFNLKGSSEADNTLVNRTRAALAG